MATNPPLPTSSNAATAEMDPGLQAYIAAHTGSIGGTAIDSTLQATLLGTTNNPRIGLTNQPLVNLWMMPRWARNVTELRQAVYKGTLDPYLPSTDPKSWQVYMSPSDNSHTTEGSSAAAAEYRQTQRGDVTRTVSSVANDPLLWSEDEIKKAIKRFNDAGMTNVNDLPSLQQAWGNLAQMAGARYSLSSGKIKVTPWDMLDLYKKTNTGGSGSGGGGGFTGTHSSVQKTVSEISQGDAWASLRQTTQQLLGHDPSDQEVRDFAYRMNSLAARNPTISKTTGTYADGALTNSTTKTSGGFTANDVQQHAYDDAQNDPDYAEFQSASTYFNAALSALGEIGG